MDSLLGGKLIILKKNGKNKKLYNTKGSCVKFGSHLTCQFRLKNIDAKPIHFKIIADHFQRIKIKNLCKKHPVSVNDVEVPGKRILKSGDIISIFGHKFLWDFDKNIAKRQQELFADSNFGAVTPKNEQDITSKVQAKTVPSKKSKLWVNNKMVVSVLTPLRTKKIQLPFQNVDRLPISSNIAKEQITINTDSDVDPVTPTKQQNKNTLQTPSKSSKKVNRSTKKKENILIDPLGTPELLQSVKQEIRVTRSAQKTPNGIYGTPKGILSESNFSCDESTFKSSKNLIDLSTPLKKNASNKLKTPDGSISKNLIDLITPDKCRTPSQKNNSSLIKNVLKNSAKKTPKSTRKLSRFSIVNEEGENSYNDGESNANLVHSTPIDNIGHTKRNLSDWHKENITIEELTEDGISSIANDAKSIELTPIKKIEPKVLMTPKSDKKLNKNSEITDNTKIGTPLKSSMKLRQTPRKRHNEIELVTEEHKTPKNNVILEEKILSMSLVTDYNKDNLIIDKLNKTTSDIEEIKIQSNKKLESIKESLKFDTKQKQDIENVKEVKNIADLVKSNVMTVEVMMTPINTETSIRNSSMIRTIIKKGKPTPKSAKKQKIATTTAEWTIESLNTDEHTEENTLQDKSIVIDLNDSENDENLTNITTSNAEVVVIMTPQNNRKPTTKVSSLHKEMNIIENEEIKTPQQNQVKTRKATTSIKKIANQSSKKKLNMTADATIPADQQTLGTSKLIRDDYISIIELSDASSIASIDTQPNDKSFMETPNQQKQLISSKKKTVRTPGSSTKINKSYTSSSFLKKVTTRRASKSFTPLKDAERMQSLSIHEVTDSVESTFETDNETDEATVSETLIEVQDERHYSESSDIAEPDNNTVVLETPHKQIRITKKSLTSIKKPSVTKETGSSLKINKSYSCDNLVKDIITRGALKSIETPQKTESVHMELPDCFYDLSYVEKTIVEKHSDTDGETIASEQQLDVQNKVLMDNEIKTPERRIQIIKKSLTSVKKQLPSNGREISIRLNKSYSGSNVVEHVDGNRRDDLMDEKNESSELIIAEISGHEHRIENKPNSSNSLSMDALELTDTDTTEKSENKENCSDSEEGQHVETHIIDKYNSSSSLSSSLKGTFSDTTSNDVVSRVTKKGRSPKNDLSDLKGVRELLKTPGKNLPKNDLSNVSGVKKLFKVSNSDPKNDLTDVRGVRQLLRTPGKIHSNDLNDLRGVKKLLKTPGAEIKQKSPRNDLTEIKGVKKLLATPKNNKSLVNDLTDVRGVRQIFDTPAKDPRNELDEFPGLKTLMQTPSVKNDLTNVVGVKELMQTPDNHPNNDLRDVRGVKQLLRTPKPDSNNLSNLSGVNELFGSSTDELKTAEVVNKSAEKNNSDTNDIEEESSIGSIHSNEDAIELQKSADELFDSLIGKPIIKQTYSKKSPVKSPSKSDKSTTKSPKNDEEIRNWIDSLVNVTRDDSIVNLPRKVNNNMQVLSTRFSNVTPNQSTESFSTTDQTFASAYIEGSKRNIFASTPLKSVDDNKSMSVNQSGRSLRPRKNITDTIESVIPEVSTRIRRGVKKLNINQSEGNIEKSTDNSVMAMKESKLSPVQGRRTAGNRKNLRIKAIVNNAALEMSADVTDRVEEQDKEANTDDLLNQESSGKNVPKRKRIAKKVHEEEIIQPVRSTRSRRNKQAQTAEQLELINSNDTVEKEVEISITKQRSTRGKKLKESFNGSIPVAATAKNSQTQTEIKEISASVTDKKAPTPSASKRIRKGTKKNEKIETTAENSDEKQTVSDMEAETSTAPKRIRRMANAKRNITDGATEEEILPEVSKVKRTRRGKTEAKKDESVEQYNTAIVEKSENEIIQDIMGTVRSEIEELNVKNLSIVLEHIADNDKSPPEKTATKRRAAPKKREITQELIPPVTITADKLLMGETSLNDKKVSANKNPPKKRGAAKKTKDEQLMQELSVSVKAITDVSLASQIEENVVEIPAKRGKRTPKQKNEVEEIVETIKNTSTVPENESIKKKAVGKSKRYANQKKMEEENIEEKLGPSADLKRKKKTVDVVAADITETVVKAKRTKKTIEQETDNPPGSPPIRRNLRSRKAI